MRHPCLKASLATIAALAVAGGVGALLFVQAGLYDVSASTQHLQPVFSLLEQVMHRSARRRAAGIVVPPLGEPAQVRAGAACFHAHCVQCHGAPGVAPDPIGIAMQPVPGSLVDARARLSPAEIYWITRQGVRMSGMPAWALRLDEAQLWSVVAFMQRLPDLGSADYAELTAGASSAGAPPTCVRAAEPTAPTPAPVPEAPEDTPRARAERGILAIKLHGCTGCHAIPGLVGSDPQVGPPLHGMGRRELIAGQLPNTTDNMVRWLRDPKSVDPQTTMPAMHLSETDARAIADYLDTLR